MQWKLKNIRNRCENKRHRSRGGRVWISLGTSICYAWFARTRCKETRFIAFLEAVFRFPWGPQLGTIGQPTQQQPSSGWHRHPLGVPLTIIKANQCSPWPICLGHAGALERAVARHNERGVFTLVRTSSINMSNEI